MSGWTASSIIIGIVSVSARLLLRQSKKVKDDTAPTKKLFIDFNSNEIYDFMQKQPKPSEQEVKQTMEKYSKILKRDK